MEILQRKVTFYRLQLCEKHYVNGIISAKIVDNQTKYRKLKKKNIFIG